MNAKISKRGFACIICEKAFARNIDLRTHLEAHSLTSFAYDQGPDFDDMSSFFHCIICGSFKYINPGYELLVTKM
jgi:hypothetical protein